MFPTKYPLIVRKAVRQPPYFRSSPCIHHHTETGIDYRLYSRHTSTYASQISSDLVNVLCHADPSGEKYQATEYRPTAHGYGPCNNKHFRSALSPTSVSGKCITLIQAPRNAAYRNSITFHCLRWGDGTPILAIGSLTSYQGRVIIRNFPMEGGPRLYSQPN